MKKRLLLCLLFSALLAGCTGVAAANPLPTEATRLAAAAGAQPSVLVAPAATPETPTAVIPTDKLSSGAAPISAPPSPATTTAVLYAYGPSGFPTNINPLTGMPAADPALLERRPMAIKVTNFPRTVRPQWGLSQADHVYEYFIGDHMTRFIGVFYGRDSSQVGPVRSARFFDEQVLRMYDAIFVFGWADDPIVERLTQPDIRNQLVVERGNNCPPLCRLDSGHGYNNLFTDTHLLSQYVTERGTDNARPDLDGLRFELAVPPSGHPGDSLSIKFSNVSYHSWQYDPVRGQYLRFQETQDDRGQEKIYAPLIDSLNGNQLAADNLVILYTTHQVLYQSSSTTIYDMPFTGRGVGYALRDGQLYPLAWTRLASSSRPSLALPDGQPYPLKPGNVWFEILGETSKLEPVGSAAWNFSFSIP